MALLSFGTLGVFWANLSVAEDAEPDRVVVQIPHKLEDFASYSIYSKFKLLIAQEAVLPRNKLDELQAEFPRVAVFNLKALSMVRDPSKRQIDRVSSTRITQLLLGKLVLNSSFKVYNCSECGVVKVVVESGKIKKISTIGDNDRIKAVAKKMKVDGFMFWDAYYNDDQLILSLKFIAADGRLVWFVEYEIENEDYDPHIFEFYLSTFTLPAMRSEVLEGLRRPDDSRDLPFYGLGIRYTDYTSSEEFIHSFGAGLVTNSDKSSSDRTSDSNEVIYSFTGINMEYQLGYNLDSLILTDPYTYPTLVGYGKIGLAILRDTNPNLTRERDLSKTVLGGGITYRFLEIYSFDFGAIYMPPSVDTTIDDPNDFQSEQTIGGFGYELRFYVKF